MGQIIDGRKISNEILEEIMVEVQKIKSEGGKTPHLAAVLVGDDGASITYVNGKVKACEKVGFESTLIHLPASTSEASLLTKVRELNDDPEIDGFIVQVPLPDHIDEQNQRWYRLLLRESFYSWKKVISTRSAKTVWLWGEAIPLALR